MTREEAKAELNKEIDEISLGSYTYDGLERSIALEIGIKALEQEPCEDAISRQAVIEIAESSKSNWIDNSVLFKRVNELPPVTPKPKTGHWIYRVVGIYRYASCSECNKMQVDESNYCPNCGVEMEN